MKRVIVDYRKLNPHLLDLLVERYPDGYGDEDIISFRNAQAEWVECVEVTTEDTMYLVKVSKRLMAAMEEHDEDDIELNGAKDFEEE